MDYARMIYCNRSITIRYYSRRKEELGKSLATTPKAKPKTETVKRDWIGKAIEFIRHYEWVRLKAYWDASQWSIWYWTRSYEWEVITQEIADQRLYDNVKTRWDKTTWTPNQRAALTSFVYNCWPRWNILDYSKKGDHKSVIYLMNSYCKTAWGKRLKGLVKRRNAEVELYKTI